MKTIFDFSSFAWIFLAVAILIPLIMLLMDSLRLFVNRQFRLLRLSPLFLLALPFLFNLGGCKSGDILSEDKVTDNSTVDNHQIGDTTCTTSCTTHEDGSVEYEKTCNGAQVSSGSFNDGTTCAEIIKSQQEGEAGGGVIDDGDDDDLQCDPTNNPCLGNPINLP